MAQALVLCGAGLASGQFVGAAEGQGLAQACGQQPKPDTMTQLVDAALLGHWAWQQRAGTARLRARAHAGMAEDVTCGAGTGAGDGSGPKLTAVVFSPAENGSVIGVWPVSEMQHSASLLATGHLAIKVSPQSSAGGTGAQQLELTSVTQRGLEGAGGDSLIQGSLHCGLDVGCSLHVDLHLDATPTAGLE